MEPIQDIIVNVDTSTIESQLNTIISNQESFKDLFNIFKKISETSLLNLQSYFYILLVVGGFALLIYLFYRFTKTFI